MKVVHTIFVASIFYFFLSVIVFVYPNNAESIYYSFFISNNSYYVHQISDNIKEHCIELSDNCYYYEATNWVYNNVQYSYIKESSPLYSRLKTYESIVLVESIKGNYINNIINNTNDNVCTDMSILLCSILKDLGKDCELDTRYVIENNSYDGHMFVKGRIGGRYIYCDPTNNMCWT